MLDIRLIRERPEEVRAALRKVDGDARLDDVIRLDGDCRRLQTENDGLKAEVNAKSRLIGAEKDAERREALKADAARHKARITELDEQLRGAEEQRDALLLELPNLPHPSVPDGKDDSENRVVREVGERRELGFAPLPHWDLAPRLGIIDFDRGVKISGSRFYVLCRDGARLQRALIAFMLDVHIERHGYVEVYPPYMVKRDCLVGTAQLPKFGENLYRDAEEDFWWVPTAEVPVTNLYRDEILPGERLPIKHVAYTACFRREQMAAGRDTRGIKRGHQFDKVEMVKFVREETSMQELDRLIADAAEILELLGIPYRVVQMCTGDLSFAAMAKYDLEAWAPGCGEWLEVSSCSNFGDFQSRRARIRYRDGKDKPRYPHTLNGSGLALPRTVIAILENYQQADGSVVIPEALRPYMGGRDRITPGPGLP